MKCIKHKTNTARKTGRIITRMVYLSVALLICFLPACDIYDPEIVEHVETSIERDNFQFGSGGNNISMIYIEPGEFRMGAGPNEDHAEDNEYPRHPVEFTDGFWIGQFEVTQEQWYNITDDNPSLSGDNPFFPVENVSFSDIVEIFLPILNSTVPGTPWRLPTEAEWEYACRAGTSSPYVCENEYVNYYIRSAGEFEFPHEIGELLPNPWGIHDMHGNVWEWCLDNYHDAYDEAPRDGSVWIDTLGQGRVLRGGSYLQPVFNSRSAKREWQNPDYSRRDIGFRLVFDENYQNLAPYKPLPFEAEIVEEGVLSIVLSWSCSDPEGDPLEYDLFFGTNSTPPLVISNTIDTTVTLQGINFGQTYFWKVIARDEDGETSVSSVQRLTTSIPVESSFELANTGLSIDMILIEPGSFEMGTAYGDQHLQTDEYPRHMVEIDYRFWIGKFELTQDQWETVTGSNPSFFTGCADCPVENISWEEIHDFFLPAINAFEEDSPWRMPTEAEWEYACRAGSGEHFPWGDDPVVPVISDYTWYSENSDDRTHDTGLLLPNAWGIHDMIGNVMEWCEDWYHPSYDLAPSDGSAWLDPLGVFRVFRGGAWESGENQCRSAYRYAIEPTSRSSTIGFRLVRDF